MRRERTPFVERSEGVAKLSRFLALMADRYRKEDIPVGSDGRIDMNAYRELYPQHLRADFAQVQAWQETWRERQTSLPGIPTDADGFHNRGEAFEMLATAVFQKKLGDGFVVARSSLFDDLTHKVDTIVLDRETGALVCAFDEIGDTTGPSYDEKLSLIRDRNFHGGAKLKYGLAMKADGDKKKVVKSAVQNVPIFRIALNDERINQGLEEFNPRPDTCSDFEEKLFAYFVAIINAQIAALKLDGNRLNSELRKNLSVFRSVMSGVARRAGLLWT